MNVLKKLTYGLDRHTITLRRVTLDGELNSGNKEQYSVSVKKDLTPALSMLECALIQVNYSATRKAAESDKSRGLMAKRVGWVANEDSIYIPTLCIIGSIMHVSSKHKIYDLKDISEAVSKKNELWEQGVKDFNNLFSQEDVRCLKKAVRHPQGRRILNRFLAGLRFVTDLFYESYALKKDGLFEESYAIDEIISNIGIMQMDAYLLLLSPQHPEYEALVKFIDDYSSSHELYLSDSGRWVMVNKRVVKNVNIELLEQYLQALDDGGVTRSKVGTVGAKPIAPKINNQKVLDVREDEIRAKEEVVGIPELESDIEEPDSDVDDFIEQSGFSGGIKEPDSDVDDFIEQSDFGSGIEEPDYDDEGLVEPDYDEMEPKEPDHREIEQTAKNRHEQVDTNEGLYSTQRQRPAIRQPDSAREQSKRSLFSKPSNAESINFDVDDI